MDQQLSQLDGGTIQSPRMINNQEQGAIDRKLMYVNG
jgi:hypothetical protein